MKFLKVPVILNPCTYSALQVAAIDLVREIMISTGEEVEVRKYKRLTELKVEVSSNLSNNVPLRQ